MAPSRGAMSTDSSDNETPRIIQNVFELPNDLDDPETETPTLESPNTSSMSNTDMEPTISVDDDDTYSSTASDTGSSSSSSSSSFQRSISRSSRSSRNRRNMLHHSSSSLLMSSFAPPFYNRPPTPLPPSPSLTSLFRPSFSTTTSRPSTPDDSDVETESAVARGAMMSKMPRAHPKVPTYEYYGFALYLMSSLSFLMYILWSYLPEPFLDKLGIRYYPNRWWSLAIPSFIVMTIIYIYVALASYNTGYLTLPMNSIENIVDEAASVAVLDRDGKMARKDVRTTSLYDSRRKDKRRIGAEEIDWKNAWSVATDAVMDVPIRGVCEVLYGDG